MVKTPDKTHSATTHCTSLLKPSWTISTREMEDAALDNDPNITHLRQLVEHFRESEDETRRRRKILDEYIRALKQEGYSYPVLSRETGMALNTVQNIIDPSARRQRGKKLAVAKPD